MPGAFNDVAGVQGFEPRSYGPEPHVLPLDDTPIETPNRGGDYINASLPVNNFALRANSEF